MTTKWLCAIFAAACLQVAPPAAAQITVTLHQTPVFADDSVCFADAYGVRRHSPDAWPSWTRRMEGHVGEKCWYPTTRDKRHEQWKEVVTTGSGQPHRSRARPTTRLAALHPPVGTPQAKTISADKVKLFIEFERWRRDRILENILPPT